LDQEYLIRHGGLWRGLTISMPRGYLGEGIQTTGGKAANQVALGRGRIGLFSAHGEAVSNAHQCDASLLRGSTRDSRDIGGCQRGRRYQLDCRDASKIVWPRKSRNAPEKLIPFGRALRHHQTVIRGTTKGTLLISAFCCAGPPLAAAKSCAASALSKVVDQRQLAGCSL
jgi:hypothetical protein